MEFWNSDVACHIWRLYPGNRKFQKLLRSLLKPRHAYKIIAIRDIFYHRFVRNQDETNGGWKVGVTREIANRLLILPPGWLSAMGQGQAMSVLSRAYHLTHDDVYLQAALKAIKPFHFESNRGGVVAHLFDKFPW